jgi:hypothetical protein
MDRPRIFIGSSTEGLDVANAVHQNLDRIAEVTIWTQGAFQLSIPTITSLMNSLTKSDYAIFIFYPDDLTNLRGNNVSTVRDNVIFETGLFAGKLGIEKVFFLKPRNVVDLHLPTDLLGVTAGEYDAARTDKNFVAATGPFCTQVRQQITLLQNTEKIVPTEISIETGEKIGIPEIDNDPNFKLFLSYLFDKEWKAISFEKIKENIHPKFDETFMMDMVSRHSKYIRRTKFKDGRHGITIIEKSFEE